MVENDKIFLSTRSFTNTFDGCWQLLSRTHFMRWKRSLRTIFNDIFPKHLSYKSYKRISGFYIQLPLGFLQHQRFLSCLWQIEESMVTYKLSSQHQTFFTWNFKIRGRNFLIASNLNLKFLFAYTRLKKLSRVRRKQKLIYDTNITIKLNSFNIQ